MKTVLPFDDFILNRTENTKRIFQQPKWLFDQAYIDPFCPFGTYLCNVVPAPQGGYYMIYRGHIRADDHFDDEHMQMLLAWSQDGIHFEPYPTDLNVTIPHILGHDTEDIPGFVYLDETEPDPQYRYKSVHARYGCKGGEMLEEAAVVLGSDDVIHWKRISNTPVITGYSDSVPSILRNPVTGRYQTVLRRRWGERRICLTESADLMNWTECRCIVHPSPNDPPTTHFYDMPHFYYDPGEIFIGFLFKQEMPFNRIMDGTLTTEYTYSYDGLTWNRTGASVTPHFSRGEYGNMAMVESMIDQGNQILFYMRGEIIEHQGLPQKWYPGMKPISVTIPGILPKNRFVCIDSGKGRAELMTQHLMLHKPDLWINANIPFGSLRAQLLEGDTPIPGYTFDDFLPISGDVMEAPLYWRGGKLNHFVENSKWIRLHIAFEQAEVYAIMGDFSFTINTRSQIYDHL